MKIILSFVVLFSLTIYASEAAVVKVTSVFEYNCRNVIPDDPNSAVGTIKATQTYTKDLSCSNLNFTANDIFDVEINGRITQTRFNITNRSIIPQNGKLLYTSYGKITNGACTGASWGRLVPLPSTPIESCIAGNSRLSEIFSLKSWFTIIGGSCGFNLCKGTVNSFIDPPLKE